ncbi:MAG: acetate--CoA ligase family protein [Prolixibacteraceae bacterium]|nr:acetate--CoA ligase family protein [Prolixibacteraceae bacterium]
MIHEKLINPKSIVVVGASNHLNKPGGKLMQNLIIHDFKGKLYAVNPKEKEVQGVKSYASVSNLPDVDMAILAIPAAACPEAVETLARYKNTRAFIIISAGFSETTPEGKELEDRIVDIVDSVGGTLIGPNCIGLITPIHTSVFTTPVPKLWEQGCDFISGSGATAVFILEAGIPKGLRFSSMWSVGNSAQTGVEDILEYLDETFEPEKSSKVKLLYLETIYNPDKLLHHATSLVKKGCKIAAIKAGSSQAGSRAAQSHTGAMVSSDAAVEALFRKAGIVRCMGREELVSVANVYLCKELKGKRIAIATHAGGPGVMLTDALEEGGLLIPVIEDSPAKRALQAKLFPGSSVENPIDFLATGTAEQLSAIIDACEKDFDVDGMAVIYGSNGLMPVRDVFQQIDKKMHECSKPIYPILPSLIEVREDVALFLSEGNVTFPDEVLLGIALTKVMNTPQPSDEQIFLSGINIPEIRRIIDGAKSGFQPPDIMHRLFNAAGIPVVKEIVVCDQEEAVNAAREIGYPLVMKVVGPIHKTDVGGVIVNVRNEESVRKEFQHLIKIDGATSVLIAQMAFGIELFIGAKYEPRFGHVILCGLGGIYVEVMKDVSSGLAPLTMTEAMSMVKSLKSYKILQGYRGKSGVNVRRFAEIIVRLSTLLRFATEIKELDINPLLGRDNDIYAVDARIRLEKQEPVIIDS